VNVFASKPAPIVACSGPPPMHADAEHYNEMLDRLHRLEASIAHDRLENELERRQSGGWFSHRPVIVSTELRELKVIEMAEQLHRERRRIMGMGTTYSDLGGPADTPPSAPEGS
jgi:fructose-1-phosphate kinase PfkB-like protein